MTSAGYHMSIAIDTAAVGLNSERATRQPAADGPNELPTVHRRNLFREAWDVIRQPMLLLLLRAGTEVGKIGAALRTIEPQRTPLQREIGYKL